MRDTVHRRQF